MGEIARGARGGRGLDTPIVHPPDHGPAPKFLCSDPSPQPLSVTYLGVRALRRRLR